MRSSILFLDGAAALGAVLIAAVAIVIYFLPTFVANGKRNHTAIFWLNLLLGWSVLGWIAALIWALSNDAPPVVIRHMAGTAAGTAPGTAAVPSPADELTKLVALRDAGTLTEEEFTQQKQRVLRQA